ncbi:MAG: SHOCT domain-containing protein [Ruminococcus flavefaciens]|nr:SHOCT domain-containing protein [Ruminococcus flavefaciens]
MSENSLTNNVGSTLTVLDDCVKLQHKGNYASIVLGIPKGEKTLFYDDFTSVEFKSIKFLSSGYIQFNVPGHKQSKDPSTDEYSFLINEKSIEPKARMLYDKILENKKKAKSSGNMTIVNQVSSADEILKLKQLLDAGVLTQEEFDAKKKQLLGL